MSKASTKSTKGRAPKGPGFKSRALGVAEPKQKVNSKVKGNKNELKVAKAISKWTGVEFRRTPMSGAIHVPLHWLAGDIFCTDQSFNFPFAVEAKHYHKLTDGKMITFFMQAKADADRINKHPLLMARENGMPKGEWKVMLDQLQLFFAFKGFLPQVWMGHGLNCFTLTSEQLFSVPYEEIAKNIIRL